MTSKSGGVALRPVIATRMAMNRSPTFQPVLLAQGAQRRLELVGLEAALRPAPRPRVRPRPGRRRSWPRSQRLGTRMAGSTSMSSMKTKSSMGPMASSRGRRSRTIGSSGASASGVGVRTVPGRPPRPPRRARPGTAARGSTSSSSGQPADPLAVEPVEPLGVEDRARRAGREPGRSAAPARSRLKRSSSSPLLQPRSARWLTMASGM